MSQHEKAIARTVGKTVENFQGYQAYIKLDKYSFFNDHSQFSTRS